MLFILYTVGMTSFMSYKNVLAFLLIQQSCKRNETERIRKERRERETYLAPNRPTCRPSPATAPASCLARPGRQAGARRRPQHAPRSCPPPCFLPSPPWRLGSNVHLLPELADTLHSPQLLSFALPAPWPTPPCSHRRSSRAHRRP